MAKYVSKDIICAKMMHCNFRSPDMTVSDFINDELPAADVQPIRHGRWIGINEYCKKNGYIPSGMGIYYWCSECGKEEPKISDYCPNCGADMRGDKK